MRYIAATLIIFAALSTRAAAEIGAFVDRIATGLSRPIAVVQPPDDNSRLFIAEQHTGRIRILNTSNNSINSTPFLTIPSIATGGEQGLLGLAFDPNYATNGYFYVNVTTSAGGGDTEIRRYQVSGDPNVALTESTTLMRFDQPQSNHNGGWLAFNPKLTETTEQYLYIGSGDGGGGGDTGTGHTPGTGNAQDTTANLLGKILRIDVTGDDFPGDGTKNYAIPPTNPFAGEDDNGEEIVGDDEIWSYGLRNPWRNSFDRATGEMWIADVGQGAREEVNYEPAATGGRNYGWRVFEGTNCYNNDPLCPTLSATAPIHEYNHDAAGGFSITGGYVYRGPQTALDGLYFFSDYVSSKVWAFRYNGTTKTDYAVWTGRLIPDVGSAANLSSFGEDNAGNLYLVSLNGHIFRVAGTGELANLVNTGAQWKYRVGMNLDGQPWQASDFNDQTWPSGPSQLGYGESDQATTINCGPSAPACNSGNFITSYFRHEFTVADPTIIAAAAVSLLRDDGAAVYLNGEEIYRTSNLAAGASFTTPATSDITGTSENQFESTVGIDPARLLAGRNVLAVEVHQVSGTSSDVSFDFRLTSLLRSLTPGDTDFDGDVDRDDAATLARNYGRTSGAFWIDGDFNGDGSVALADLAILQGHLDGAGTSADFAAVPEPSAAVLLAGILASFGLRWRRHNRTRRLPT